MNEILQRLVTAEEHGEGVCLCIVIQTNGAVPRHAGSKMLVYQDGSTFGSVGGGGVEAETLSSAKLALRDGQPRLVHYTLNVDEKGAVGICGGEVTVYVEPQLAPTTLLILGAGHVGRSVAKLAMVLGFRVLVADERTELCQPDFFPEGVMLIPGPIDQIPEKVSINNHTFIVGVTHSSEVDISGLPALLKCKPAYIGLIGSKKRWAHTREGLSKQGMTEEQINFIKSPIGLDIKGETPDEIAVSILAEIIQKKNS